MTDRTRICLIEVGSYSIRFWVVDFDRSWRFWNVSVDDDLRDIRHHIDPSAPTLDRVKELNAMVHVLREKSFSYGCDIVLAFGSAICRNIEAVLPGVLTEKVRVLSAAQEAMAALAAAAICSGPESAQGEITVIDEGAGSTEIARGIWNKNSVKSIQSISIPIGSSDLGKMFEDNPDGYINDIGVVNEEVRRMLRKEKFERTSMGNIFLLGGVATKIAWLGRRENIKDYYKPYQINGKIVTIQAMQEEYGSIFRRYRVSPADASMYVDDRDGREDEAVRVLSGIPIILNTISALSNRASIKVSSYTVRQGLTFLIVNGEIPV